MIDQERYVDYNKRPLELLGYQFVRLEVAGVTVSKARVLVAPNSGKSIIGRDWLIALRYKITQPIKRGECNVNNKFTECAEAVNEISPEEKISPEVQQIMREIPELFKQKGRVKDYELKIDMKENAKITQQKDRRIPIQLQEQVDKEIEKLLKDGQLKELKKFKMIYLSNLL